MDVGHLARNADLVGVEIGEVLFAVFGIVKDLRQRFVAVLVGVEMGVAALVGILLRQSRTVPDEMGPLWFGAGPGQFVFAFFGESSPERVVGVFPDFGIAGFLFNLGADQLVFGVVLEVLVFAVRELAVDQVAQGVVGVFDAVVFFEAVAATNVAALPFGRFVGKDVVGGVEGEGFAAASLAVSGFLNLSDFIVNVIKDAASVIGALDQVSGFVIGVAAVEHVTTKVV